MVHKEKGRIAQLVEQLTLNQRVVGSNPTAPTNQINDLAVEQKRTSSVFYKLACDVLQTPFIFRSAALLNVPIPLPDLDAGDRAPRRQPSAEERRPLQWLSCLPVSSDPLNDIAVIA